MRLENAIALVQAGGTGSGCNPAAGKCGRHPLLGSNRYIYHGTSDKFTDSIKKNGLTGKKNYITTHPDVALVEAQRTTDGDEWESGLASKGVGGEPVIVVMKATHPSVVKAKLTPDKEYDDPDLPAWHTKDKIHPKAIVAIIKSPRTDAYMIPQSFKKNLKKQNLHNE